MKKIRKIIAWLSLLPLLIVNSAFAYTVKPGDTLSNLAYHNNTTVKELQKINSIKNPNLIYAGQELTINDLLGVNPLPEDNYDKYITFPVNGTATEIFVSRIPTVVTESIYTIFESDGRTVSEKVYCTGATSTPTNKLTGCVRGISFTPSVTGTISEAAGVGVSHPKNSRIAITDNINFTGKALAYLFGNQAIPGNFLLNNAFIIGLATPTSSATTSAANVDYVNSVAFAGAPDSSQTVKGISEVALDSELASGKADGTGNTTAPLIAHASSFNTTSVAVNKVPVGRTTDGKIDSSWGGSTSSLATLDSNILVVQNPANATSTPTANKIPIANASSTLDSWVTKKFGGDGSDGALSITTGTTTINLANAAVVVKNYTSLSITNTGLLNFSNPNTNGTFIILRSQGNCMLTSSIAPMIDASGMGATGGASTTANGSSVSGNSGSTGYGTIFVTGPGLAGQVANTTLAGGTITASVQRVSAYLLKYAQAFVGGGGGSGGAQDQGASNAVSGKGGNGGGGLIIECGGAWNFTTASGISVAGQAGGNGVYAGTRGFAQGGAGGAGGYFIALYNTLTANTGTVVSTAGAAGTGVIVVGAGTSNNTGPSGAASGVTAGVQNTASGVNTVSGPAASGDGVSLIGKNTEF